MTVLCLGIDPDTGGGNEGSGIALVTTRRVVAVAVARGAWRRSLHALRVVQAQIAAIGPTVEEVLRRAAGPEDEVARALVEVPIDYGQKRIADPNDLLRLSLVAGGAYHVLLPRAQVVQLVQPFEWKGQRKKSVDQRSTLTYFGWDYEWTPRRPQALPRKIRPAEGVQIVGCVAPQDWPQVLDAMGIGLWALSKEGLA